MYHEPEVCYVTPFCPDCDMTFLFHEVSYPGGRESEPLICPDCSRDLGGRVETETTKLIGKVPGNVGDRVLSLLGHKP